MKFSFVYLQCGESCNNRVRYIHLYKWLSSLTFDITRGYCVGEKDLLQQIKVKSSFAAATSPSALAIESSQVIKVKKLYLIKTSTKLKTNSKF